MLVEKLTLLGVRAGPGGEGGHWASPAEGRPRVLVGVHQPQAVTSLDLPGSLGRVCMSGWQLPAKGLGADRSCPG